MTGIKLPNTIKMVITDFDGVLTDNCVYIGDDGIMTRKLNFKDIIGVYKLKRHGIDVSIISGEKNTAIETLAKNCELSEVFQQIRVKIDVLKHIIEKYNLTQEEYLYIGDDYNDIECLNYAKYRITVPQAIKKVKSIKNIMITNENCGQGAFREVADCLTD